MELVEKAARLRERAEKLASGMDAATADLFRELLDFTEELALAVENVREQQEELSDSMEAMGGELEELVNAVFEVEDDDEYDDEDEEDDDSMDYAVKCPVCGTMLLLDEETLDAGEARCTRCGSLLEFNGRGDDDL